MARGLNPPNPILMMRTKNMDGPYFQKVQKGTLMHSTGARAFLDQGEFLVDSAGNSLVDSAGFFLVRTV